MSYGRPDLGPFGLAYRWLTYVWLCLKTCLSGLPVMSSFPVMSGFPVTYVNCYLLVYLMRPVLLWHIKIKYVWVSGKRSGSRTGMLNNIPPR